MNILIFGATGMVGQGVLRECLLAPDVARVQTVGRNPTGAQHAKLTELVRADLYHYDDIAPQLTGFDTCFFTLGVTSAGKKEAEYARITYDLTLAAAETLARLNPQMIFIYVSGSGTDSTEHGRSMWARVKGRTENALLRLPFRAVYNFRPGFIQPLHGIRSKTALYQFFYSALGPILPLLRRAFPRSILTTEEVGRAMLNAVRYGAPKPVLEARDILDLVNATASITSS